MLRPQTYLMMEPETKAALETMGTLIRPLRAQQLALLPFSISGYLAQALQGGTEVPGHQLWCGVRCMGVQCPLQRWPSGASALPQPHESRDPRHQASSLSATLVISSAPSGSATVWQRPWG